MTYLCSKCRVKVTEPLESCPHCDGKIVEDLAGTVIAGRYELREFIGIGGMKAPVWKALQRSTRRTVAIKLLPLEDSRAAARFEREARIASRLNHRHITIVHDYGPAGDDRMFLVMEYLQGRSLRDVMREARGMEPDRALKIAEQLLRALEHAHGQSVVHRDLKPDNVFLVKQDDDLDFVKILDFGIAKQFQSDDSGPESSGIIDTTDLRELTQETVLCGTPLYMAPEQITGESFDARIDLYALGVLTYHMVTGRLPFTGKTAYEILSKHLSEAPPPFDRVRPDLEMPAGLEAFVFKAISKRPEQRFQSAREMRVALREVRRNAGAITYDTEEPSFLGQIPAMGTQRLSDKDVPTHMRSVVMPPPPEAGKRRGWVIWALAAVVLLGVGAGVGVMVGGGGGETPDAKSAPAGSPAQAARHAPAKTPEKAGAATSESPTTKERPAGGEAAGASAGGAQRAAESEVEVVEIEPDPQPPEPVPAGVQAGATLAGVGPEARRLASQQAAAEEARAEAEAQAAAEAEAEAAAEAKRSRRHRRHRKPKETTREEPPAEAKTEPKKAESPPAESNEPSGPKIKLLGEGGGTSSGKKKPKRTGKKPKKVKVELLE